MSNIGFLHKKGGHGVTENLATAASWYRKSAESGDELGQRNLGECYFYGNGVTKNLETARSWFQKSADQGDADSLLKLGIMMVKGEGGVMILDKGRSLWEQAAAKGQEKAQENLDKLDRVVKATVFSG